MKTLNRNVLFAAALLWQGGLAAAQTRNAAWLGLARSAQSVAEANGLGVLASGLPSLGVNPAGLAEAQSAAGALSFDHSRWPGDVQAQNLGAVMSLSDGTQLALSGQWVDFGAVQATRYVPGQGVVAEGSLHPMAGAASLSLARSLQGNLEAGLSLKYLTQSLSGASTGNAAAMDAGVRGTFGPGFSLALGVANLGTALEGSSMPGTLSLGAGWRPAQGPIEAGIEMSGSTDQLGSLDVASAIRMHFNSAFVVRAGWLQMQGQEGQPSIGASFNLSHWGLDYAFRQASSLGATHHLGLGYRW